MKIAVILILLGQAYISWRTFKILPLPVWGKWVVVLLMLMALVALILRFVRQFQGVSNLPLDTVLYDVGTSWLVVLLYLVLAFAVMDIGVATHLIPKGFNHHSAKASMVVFGAVFALMVYGYVNYNAKKRVELNFTTSKPLPKPLKLVLLSDVHLGYHIGKLEFAKWVDMINAEQPDLILIAGDIIDISIRPLMEENTAAECHRLKAPVYACLGNHEYYSNQPKARRFYREAGITLLQDSVAKIGNLCIIGRDDRTNMQRKSLAKIMEEARKKGFISDLHHGKSSDEFLVLLDHQPYHLEEAEQNGIDFQFSGHTHHGQVWPVSWVTDALYEKAYGSLQKGNTRYYISSGMGIWGGKFRIGTQSEYVVLTIEQK